MLTAIKQTGQ